MRLCVASLFASVSYLFLACSPPPNPFADRGNTDATEPQPDVLWAACSGGQQRCEGSVFQRCIERGETREVLIDDCGERGLVCVPDLGCVACAPGALGCSQDTLDITRCRPDGTGSDVIERCDSTAGLACRAGECKPLCEDTQFIGTNVGCEYFAADLDNYSHTDGAAASQQYAIVVSNPHPYHTARVRIEANGAVLGATPQPALFASALIPPMDLEIFRLPAREVDCTEPGTTNTATGTCLSSQAYRVSSNVPVIAYQFNPLENFFAFSNDASLLIPTDSLGTDYRAMGWPQTLTTSPPEVVLNPNDPVELRAFLTIVGTKPNTHIRVIPHADTVSGAPLPTGAAAGTPLEFTLGPFDVLNLESGSFHADYSGSVVTSDAPVAVFSGNECSDVPAWDTLGDRRCCCDHLEAQQVPRSTLGTKYIAVHGPNRTNAVYNAGAPVARVDNEQEFFRVMAVSGDTHVTTSLPSDPDDPTSPSLSFDLGEGEVRTLRARRNFELSANHAISVANFMASQQNTGIPLVWPGGDGSFVPMPPEEQWRSSYVFLTPAAYAFDFVSVVARPGSVVRLDDQSLPNSDCQVERSDGCVDSARHPCGSPRYLVYQCQLSFPRIDPDLPYPQNTMPGRQQDGVHTVRASEPVAVLVWGFDLRVSYGYPAGLQLRPLF